MSNTRRRASLWIACLTVLFGGVAVRSLAAAPGTPETSAVPAHVTTSQITATVLNAPMSFEVNQGQTDSSVNFIARGSGYTVFLTSTESVMVLQQREATALSDNHDPVSMESAPIKQSVVRMKLEGANPTPTVSGMEQLPGIVNYFIGNDPAKWRTKIPTYAKVNYEEVYPGIDMAYYGNQGKLEYDFIVSPGADPNQIKLAFEGVSAIKIAESGALLLATALGEVRLQKPVVYQVANDGHKKLIQGNYYASHKSPKKVGIQLASYDHAKPVVIDPVLDYMTYLGGRLGDANPRVALDSMGNAYVAGMTGSLNFPTTGGSYDSSFSASPLCPGITVTNTTCVDSVGVNVNFDYFVSKINHNGTALLYSTYIGGTGNDSSAPPIVVDSSGSAYIAGQTRSADFPVTTGAFQTTAHHSTSCMPSSNCSADGFIVKLDPSGSSLVYSTYFGGSGGDFLYGIAVDQAGFIYVTGDFASADFPITPGAFSSVFGRGLLAKLNQTGTGLVWSTRMGMPGNGFHDGRSVTIDSAGNLIVIGGAATAVMPVVGGVQPGGYGGNSDAFLWKFNQAGTALLFSSYLGGSGVDWGYGVAVDASDNIYVSGYTQSVNFPTTPGSYDESYNGDSDIFVTKLSALGSSLIFSTYIGGSSLDENRNEIRVDMAGNAYVSGTTTSSDFPLVDPLDSTSSSSEVALVKLSANGSVLSYSTFIGGSFADSRPSIALGPHGEIYVAALTHSLNLPVSSGAFQMANAGDDDIFIAKISVKPIAHAGTDQSVPEGTVVTLDATGSTGGSLTYAWTKVAGPTVGLSGATTAHPTFAAPNVPAAGGTVTLELVVCEGTSSNCSDPDTVNVHITDVNHPPVAQAGPDQTVQESSPVILDGTASYDPDIDPLTYTWLKVFGPPVTLAYPNTATPSFTAPSVGPGGAQVDFELIVTDPRGLNHSDFVSVHISNVNQPPVANAGLDQTKNEQTLVTLDGSGSLDPDLDSLNYSWTQTGGPSVLLIGANTPSQTFTAPNVAAGGTLLKFKLVVTDGQANSVADTVQIAVVNVNDPPVCTLAQANPNLLWPPNHTMTQVSIVGLTDPQNQTLTITYPTVKQDEPINGLGDGDTSPDAAVSGNDILLRAERTGTGNGRVYVIHFTATNAEGAQCSGTVNVTVPHNKKDQAIQGPQLYNSFGQ